MVTDLLDITDTLTQLIISDSKRVDALEAVYRLALPDCFIAAGFVRNAVWDHLHGKTCPTPLNDLDVIYFDPNDIDYENQARIEAALTSSMPELNWQVRNQALMHYKNGDQPYSCSLDAMRYWPEKETAVAIRKTDTSGYQCISAFGFETLFEQKLTHNPKRSRAIFENRLKSKGWLVHWPNLIVEY